MHQCSGQGCGGCAREAAEVIERDGYEGVQTAGFILKQAGLGNADTARGMADAQTARNVREAFPGIKVTGSETDAELQTLIKRHKQARREEALSPAARAEVRQARDVLRRHGLK